MTNQEIMDLQWEWWVVQKRPRSAVRLEEATVCRYRGDDGARCAVGVVLTDEEAADCEGASICRTGIGLESHRLYPNYALLNDLQLAHDGCGCAPAEFTSYMKGQLLRLAFAFQLTVPGAA